MSSLEQRLSARLSAVRILVKQVLQNPLVYAWTVRRGALRTRFDDWRFDISNAIPNTPSIRSHPWSSNSWLIVGRGTVVRYDEEPRWTFVPNYSCRTVKTGEQDSIYLQPTQPEVYEAGDSYAQAGIHATHFADGSVTMSTRTHYTGEDARVFWPIGEERVDVKPRFASGLEIWRVTQHSLHNWF